MEGTKATLQAQGAHKAGHLRLTPEKWPVMAQSHPLMLSHRRASVKKGQLFASNNGAL